MLTLAQTLAFLLAAVLITATPGPDNLMVLGMGMSRGRAQGIAFGLGCALGCLSHTLLAVVGVSALIAASPWAFTALKWAGGAYLVWLGVQALRSTGGARVQAGGASADSLHALFFKGMLANAINPKVVLFFLSFLPQFVVPARRRGPAAGAAGPAVHGPGGAAVRAAGLLRRRHRRLAEPPPARRPVAGQGGGRGLRGAGAAHDSRALTRFVNLLYFR